MKSKREYIRRYVLLTFALFVNALGVAFITKATLGTSPISSLPYVLSFAIDGLTSFSTRPLRFITYLGLSFIVVSFAVIIYALYRHFSGHTIEGWTSLLVSLWFIGGVILLAVGITGEYIGKIYIETKGRPRYFIEEVTGLSKSVDEADDMHKNNRS